VSLAEPADPTTTLPNDTVRPSPPIAGDDRMLRDNTATCNLARNEGGAPMPPAIPARGITPPKRPLLRRPAASRYLLEVWGVQRAPATLAKLAVIGGGPRFLRANRWPLYAPDELDSWAGSLLGEPVASTSEHKSP
jgi:hypothetical protein